MNRRAQELGAADTHFVNPHGLYASDHYSTAYDLALITRAAMNHPLFRELVATKVVEISRQDPEIPSRVINHNKLLWRADFVDGVKTGYVNQSGHCLVASGTREGWQLIAVVLDSPDMYAETLALLEYGFSTYQQRIHARAGDALGRAPVRRGKNGSVPAVCEWTLSAVTGPGQPDAARLETTLDVVEAPIAQGDPVGEARLLLDGTLLARTPLLAAQPVPRTRFSATTTWALRALAFLALALFMVRTHAKIVKANRRRRGGFPPQGR
jgi:D-alanyl-D-alanine carboxypeptidase (penicillin-binding protein 5/6)